MNTDMTSGLSIEDISDNLPIFTLCKLINIAKSKQPMYTNRIKLNDNTKANLLEITTWESVLNEYDVDIAYNNFVSLFTKQLLNITCPFSKIKIKN